jgi:SAM-dependent methyltransferase
MVIPYHVKFPYLDWWKGLVRGKLLIQRRLRAHLRDQSKGWPSEQQYTHGYFYQGLEELGITGAKPTGFRFRQYEVDAILQGADVLDIGSNCGFVAVHCGRLARSVVAVELNPYLNRIAVETARHFKHDNVEVVESDFSAYETGKRFDVVLSFSNHHTIDGNLNMGFENYIHKIASLLKPNGYLLFESHNVFGPGTGGVGDDGDMAQKVAIMNKRFEIDRYKMVRCFLKHGVEDLDKLFIVARKSDSPSAAAFDLDTAIQKYTY